MTAEEKAGTHNTCWLLLAASSTQAYMMESADLLVTE